ncbi:MAG: SPOR domain-containing protein, partial [Oceanospirillaceae bacterium]|nr:SPOR domain-containing protein [Oceanospirillaceae bacterium]
IQASPDEIRIAIGGTQELVTLIARVVADQAPLDFIHNEVLGPFNRLETEEFIQLRFVRGSDFSAKQLSEIYLKSQGYPGLILQLTNEMIKSGKISLNNKSNLLPVPHIIGIAVLLTAITTVSSWQYFSDDSLMEEELVDTLVVDVESGIATHEIELQVEQHSEKAENLKQQISSLSTKIKAQELLIETAREDSDPQRETVELQLDAMALVDDTSSPTIASESLQLKQALKPEQPETQPVLNEVAVISTVQNAETLAAPIVPSAELSDITNINKGLEEKIAAAEQELSVVIPVVEKIKPIEQEIVAKVKPIEREVKSPSAVQEKAETVDNKQQAVSNIEKADVTQELRQLTAELQSKIPSHMLETKQIEMQGKVLVQESSFSKKEQANTTKIAAANRLNTKESELAAKQSLNAVVKIVTQPVGRNAKLDAQSISAWPSTGYTLQLLGSRSDKGVLKFLKEMPNSAKMRYFQTKLKNKPWHVVIYGQYPSRSVANSAKAALPAKLKQLKPWVKSIKSVKVDINK